MRKIQAKQIHRLFQSSIFVTSIAGTATSTSVTADLAAAVVGAGWRNTDVPNAAYVEPTYPLVDPTGLDTEAPGWRISGDNRVDLWVAGTEEKLTSVSGEEVFGRLADSTGTINLFTMEGSTETAYALPVATSIDASLPYVFTFDTLPLTGITGTSARISQDPTGLTYAIVDLAGMLTVATQTFSALTIAYDGTGDAVLNVNGQVHELANGSFSFDATNTLITWNAANAGFFLDATDIVTARYTV